MNLLSRIARRFVTPHDAASVVAKHGAEARRLTAKQKSDAVHAELRAWVEAKRGAGA